MDPKDKLVTLGDLEDFRNALFEEIRNRLCEKRISDKKWFKTKEVLKILKISPGKLQRLRSDKTLPYTPIGGVFYYDEEDIMRLLEENKRRQ